MTRRRCHAARRCTRDSLSFLGFQTRPSVPGQDRRSKAGADLVRAGQRLAFVVVIVALGLLLLAGAQGGQTWSDRTIQRMFRLAGEAPPPTERCYRSTVPRPSAAAPTLGGFFMTTKPDRSRCSTSRLAPPSLPLSRWRGASERTWRRRADSVVAGGEQSFVPRGR